MRDREVALAFGAARVDAGRAEERLGVNTERDGSIGVELPDRIAHLTRPLLEVARTLKPGRERFVEQLPREDARVTGEPGDHLLDERDLSLDEVGIRGRHAALTPNHVDQLGSRELQ